MADTRGTTKAVALLLFALSACASSADLSETPASTSPTTVTNLATDATVDNTLIDTNGVIRSSDTGLALNERRVRCELFSVSLTEDMLDIAKTAAETGPRTAADGEISGLGLIALEESLPATLARADELDCPVATIYGDACTKLLDAAAATDGTEAEVLITTGTAVCELGRVPIDLAPFDRTETDAEIPAQKTADETSAAPNQDGPALTTVVEEAATETDSITVDLQPTPGIAVGQLRVELSLTPGWTSRTHPSLAPSRVLSRSGANRMVGQLLLDEWVGTSLDKAVPLLEGYRITADESSELGGAPARRVTATDGEIIYAQTTTIIAGWRISIGAFIDSMPPPQRIDTEEIPMGELLDELWLMAANMTVSSR